jgi:hypothetical protein
MGENHGCNKGYPSCESRLELLSFQGNAPATENLKLKRFATEALRGCYIGHVLPNHELLWW